MHIYICMCICIYIMINISYGDGGLTPALPTARWTTRVFFTPDSGVLRDQICTTYGLKVNCVRAS